MRVIRSFLPLLVLVTLAAVSLAGQAKPTAAEIDRRIAAHTSDFDYLLGDWQFTSMSKEWGPGGGRWSTLQLENGQIFDEYRVLGDSGQTWYMTQTVRSYNALSDQWELVSLDHGTGLSSVGTARKVGDEMHLRQTFTNLKGPTGILRIRYYDISADHFRWTADRSTDGGKRWVLNYLTIEAQRTGPARTLAPLTAVRPGD